MPPPVAGVVVRLTLKLAPSAPIPEGTARGRPALFVIVTAFAFAPLRLCVFPLTTADAALNFTVPKLSSGAIPRPTLGASWIHSADDFDELYRIVAV